MRQLLILATTVVFSISSLQAQLNNLGKNVLGKLDKNPVNAILKTPDPISTSFKDVNMAGALEENFGNDKTYHSITQLQRTPNGGFVLQPGFYEAHVQSYCLKAGTYGPNKGDGYMYAATNGPREEAVLAIVRNSVQYPNIKQSNIQQLLWAVIAKTKFKDLQNNLKLIAAQLLTPQQLVNLNGGALGFVPDKVMQQGIANLPPAVQMVMEAENKLRGMLTSADATFEDMERIAVFAGIAPDDGSTQVPGGKWSLHPDGYYVRYMPRAYSYTVIQLYIPEEAAAVGKEFDPATHIATPANTSKQRLIQSGRLHQE